MTSDLARRRFADMVAPHLDDAYGLARWLTGSATDAEDVVQEACIRALAALDGAPVERGKAVAADDRAQYRLQLARQEPPEGRRVDRTTARRSKRRRPRPRRTRRTRKQALIAAADEAALEAAIGALPHVFREVVVMRDINGLSYREIAAAIGAPIGTVMSRLARGRASLVASLGGVAMSDAAR